MLKHGKIVKNAYIIAAGTLASRFLGFIRDVLLANFFGTSAILEAFIVSFRLSNISRGIFAEGFSESVATPILSEYKDNKSRLFELSNHLLSFFIVILLVFVLLGIIFAKFLVIVMAPGFVTDSFKFKLAVSFTRLTFIYLFLIALAANVISLLYVLKKFFAAAINPIFLNISLIVGVIFFGRFFQKYLLIVCVIVAGFLQLLFPFISLQKEGFSFRFSFLGALGDKTIIKMLRLFVPRIWSSLVYHLSVFIDTIFSSLTMFVGEGALASLYYANRLIQFPFAIIALSISRVAIVDLSFYHRQGNMEDFKKLFVFSFQNIIFFIIPLVVFFIFLSPQIIEVLFFRGEFSLDSLNKTSSVLFFYSFGLFFFCGIKLLVNSFYSLKDTATPAKTASVALIVNIIFSAILMLYLGIGGVALGTSISAGINFFLLYIYLRRRIGEVDWQDTGWQFFKVLLLSIALGIFAKHLWKIFIFNKYLKMLAVLGSALVIFLLSGYALGLRQIRYFKQWILKKR